MAKPALLIWTKNMGLLVGDALDDSFEVIRLYEEADPEAVIDARGPEVVATLTIREPLDGPMLDRFPNLKVIAVPGAGYEGVDVAAARERGIRVTNAGDTNSADVADHAVALALAAIQRLGEGADWILGNKWVDEGLPPRRRGMSDERIGIVGLGFIGRATAERLVPFGCEIAWWGPRPKDAPWPRKDSLVALAKWATTLIVAARGDASGLVTAEVIEALGPDGVLVNVARGQVIDEPAMIAALRNGRLGRAALDVFAAEPAGRSPWADVPNVIVTPHVGGFTDGAMARVRAAALKNLSAALDDAPLVNEVFA